MSLSRTALRLVTMEAMRPTGTPDLGPWPTLAGGSWFDSRLDPINDMAPKELRPVGTVYTEIDEGTSGQKSGGPPYHRTVDLTLELAIVARSDSDTNYEAGVPETDAELEASLDLLEAQVRFILFYGPTGGLFRALSGRKVGDIRSVPHRTSEDRARLAMRTLTLPTTIPDDCFEFAPSVTPEGLARLPQPLRGVIEALAETSYGKKIGIGLAAAAPVMPTAVKLTGVSMGMDVANPDGVRDGVADVSGSVDNLDQ